MCSFPLTTYETIQSIAALAIAGTFIIQYRLNRMQAVQLRINILPIIKLEYELDEPFFDPDEKNVGKIKITCKKNNVYELWFEVVDRKDIIFELNGISNLMEDDIYIKLFSYDKGDLPYFILKACFKDLAGNEYIQIFKYWEGTFLPSVPVLKSEYNEKT